MPVGTPVHARTFARCTSLNYREWAGCYAVGAYASHHEREYHAIRHAAALLDVSPLHKYLLSGPDALRLVNRIVTRDVRTLAPGQVCYTPWCDEDGTVLDDGIVARVDEQHVRWTAAEPALRWLRQNAPGLDVAIDDVSEGLAALALQGPMAAGVLRAVASGIAIDHLRYHRTAPAVMAGAAVHVSRTGYTGDLGYEIWIEADDALGVWDALVDAGRAFDLEPAGLLALDVARIEAGLPLIGVDFHGARAALAPSQRYTPFEMGLDRLVDLGKGPFVGRDALRRAAALGPARRIVGLEVDWPAVEALFERAELPPAVPAAASRLPVPVRRGRRQVGRATSSTWSPVLKRFIALATVEATCAGLGTRLEIEVTVDATRHFVGATVVSTPFFAPDRKTRTPPP